MGRPLAQSIELYLDRHSEQAVRNVWLELSTAGFSSLHSSDSPRTPHVSICVVREPQSFEPLLPDITRITAAALGQAVTLKRFESFAPYRGRCVLYLALDVSDAVAQVAKDVQALARNAGMQFPAATVEDGWVPHCTLSRRVRPDDLDAAIEVAGRIALPSSSFVRAVVHGRGAGIGAQTLNLLTPEQADHVDARDR